MPELAEVDRYRRRWEASLGKRLRGLGFHAQARVLRGVDCAAMEKALTGARLLASESNGKQMLFRFSGDVWLGVHLGMSGELRSEPTSYEPSKHDHLVLFFRLATLIFADPRMFGRVRFHQGPEAPAWWTSLAPSILSKAFTRQALAEFLKRRGRAPLKAVLLMQERFPGIGNWMADEILWRAGLHPRRPAGSLEEKELSALHRETRRVCQLALERIGARGEKPPATWLFSHRWSDGGLCPKTGAPLVREEIGGRTTCWSPGRQKF